MKQGNKIAIVIVLGLVVLFGAGQFFTASVTPVSQQSAVSNQQSAAGSQPAPTQVLAYAPPVLASGPKIESGSCWTGSIAAPYRKDAWRCAVGDGISDPCFQIPNNTNLICGVDPQDPSSAFILQPTKPLPAPNAIEGPVPTNWGWLVELQGGTLCSPFTGTRPFAAGGESANYSCAPGTLGNDVMIFGDLNASSSVWTAKVGTLSTSTKVFPPKLENAQVVNVVAVWQ